MVFPYKKQGYENIYEWAETSNANCFYCKEENQPLAHVLIKRHDVEKGICTSCLNDFEVGHLGTDRHVIECIMPIFSTHKEARNWLSKWGKFLFTETLNAFDDEPIYVYHFINNPETYERINRAVASGEVVSIGIDDLYSYNSVEISESGHVHIIY